MSGRDLLRSSDKKHLMLLYDDEVIRSNAEVECINKGLEQGKFCVYASVDINDKKLATAFAAKIKEYDKHVQNNSLLVVDFKPFYDSALVGRLELFEELAYKIECKIDERAAAGHNSKTLIVADAACNLTKNKYFGQAAKLENWWQNTFRRWTTSGLDITIICAHPSRTLNEEFHDYAASHISRMHSLTLDLKDFVGSGDEASKSKSMHILVAEPEKDIRSVYEWAFEGISTKVETVATGQQCLDRISVVGSEFDIVFIDTHLQDIDGVKVAEQLLKKRPQQKIVFTTTSSEGVLRSAFQGVLKLSNVSILVKPFEFTSLLDLIKPAVSQAP
jgi:CheY-like chemotaxis protein